MLLKCQERKVSSHVFVLRVSILPLSMMIFECDTVGKPRTDSVPPTMQSQIPKSRDVTLFFLDHDALQVSGHALLTSTSHVFLLNIFINKTERSIHFY